MLVDEVARDGTVQARPRSFLEEKVREGRPAIGLYPLDEAARAEHEARVKDKKD